MTKYLTAYRQYILKCLEDDGTDFERLLDYHREHIRFFMHERFIHLIVMVLFALATVACFLVIAVSEKIILLPLAAALTYDCFRLNIHLIEQSVIILIHGCY